MLQVYLAKNKNDLPNYAGYIVDDANLLSIENSLAQSSIQLRQYQNEKTLL